MQRLFFDTNTLNQGWPVLSVKVRNTITAARKLGFVVVLAMPVRMELHRRWRKRIEDRLKCLHNDVREINAFTSPELHLEVPNLDVLESRYDEQVSRMIEHWGIEIAPLASRPLAEVFDHATRRELVFEDKGKNFQDVVIFLSIVEYMSASPHEPATIITDDKIFTERQVQLSRYAQDRKIPLSIWTLDYAETKLTDMLDVHIKTRFATHKELALSAAMAALPEFKRVLNSSFEGVSYVLRDFDLTVDDVDVPLFEEDPAIGQETTFTVLLKGSAVHARFDHRFQEKQPIEVKANGRATFDGHSYVNAKLSNYTLSWQEN